MILHEVLTPEKVPIRYRVAGPGARFLAWLVDAGFLLLLGFAGILAGGVLEAGRPGLGQAVIGLWLFGLTWGYFLLFEWLWRGQTPGKRLVGLRVLQGAGTAITGYQAAVRNLLRLVDALPLLYALGFAVSALDRAQRRLGDLAADTLVVHVEQPPRPLPGLASAVTVERARQAALRPRLGLLDREQQQALLDLCARREQLAIPDRARLFQDVAHYLRDELGLAPEPHESAEKFVLAAAAVLAGRA